MRAARPVRRKAQGRSAICDSLPAWRWPVTPVNESPRRADAERQLPEARSVNADAIDLSRENPFAGPLTYIEAWREYFFGREAEKCELFERVQQFPVTVLYGKSGTGKSSLLQAGLYPMLREHHFVPIHFPLKLDARLIEGKAFL